MKSLILFDVDGVLVDVSRSYQQSIVETVHFYLYQILGLQKASDPLIIPDDIAALKYFGGFNDDWDLTSALIYCLLSRVPHFMWSCDPRVLKPMTIHALRAKRLLGNMSGNALLQRKCLLRFLAHIDSRDGGLSAIQSNVPSFLRNILLHNGSIKAKNLVRRIFQEIYLGHQEFERIYKTPAIYVKKRGAFRTERLLPTHTFLRRLIKNHTLAIVTGRCRDELSCVLDRHDIRKYFDIIVPIDTAWKEERRYFQKHQRRTRRGKPHPFMLLYAAQKGRRKWDFCYYIGDQPDDIKAANRAKRTFTGFVSIGYDHTKNPKHTKVLKQQEPDYVIHDWQSLLSIIQ